MNEISYPQQNQILVMGGNHLFVIAYYQIGYQKRKSAFWSAFWKTFWITLLLMAIFTLLAAIL